MWRGCSSDGQALVISTFSFVGLLSSNGMRCVCLYVYASITWNKLIYGYANVVHTENSFHPHTHTHTHTHTHILIPFEDRKLTVLKVDIAQASVRFSIPTQVWLISAARNCSPKTNFPCSLLLLLVLGCSNSPSVQSHAIKCVHIVKKSQTLATVPLLDTSKQSTCWISLWRQSVAAQVARELKTVTRTICLLKNGCTTCVKSGTQKKKTRYMCGWISQLQIIAEDFEAASLQTDSSFQTFHKFQVS